MLTLQKLNNTAGHDAAVLYRQNQQVSRLALVLKGHSLHNQCWHCCIKGNDQLDKVNSPQLLEQI